MAESQRHAPRDESPLDPVYRHTRREAWVILAAWAVCLVWSVGYCVLFGYHTGDEPVAKVLGMPSWVFFGVALPWVAATAFSIVFALCFMAEDDLGEEFDAADVEEAHADD